ncbi:hypothetical protein K413DRAFT_4008 [Clostridium sp. ASBs410]|nr:hypothetical protein K413DRAFT_4008 [Clostridium sp. ASBs410]
MIAIKEKLQFVSFVTIVTKYTDCNFIFCLDVVKIIT